MDNRLFFLYDLEPEPGKKYPEPVKYGLARPHWSRGDLRPQDQKSAASVVAEEALFHLQDNGITLINTARSYGHNLVNTVQCGIKTVSNRHIYYSLVLSGSKSIYRTPGIGDVKPGPSREQIRVPPKELNINCG